MKTKFNLIKEAQNQATKETIITTTIVKNIDHIASNSGLTRKQVTESITHVLAGLAQTAKNMNPRTTAMILAGVDRLSQVLPQAQKPEKTIQTLAAAAMRFDDLTRQHLPNQAVVQIAQYGSKFSDLVQKYLSVTENPQQLDSIAKQLMARIDKAMTRQSTVAAGPAAAGATPTA